MEVKESASFVGVTALQFHKDLLISGQGSYCHVYKGQTYCEVSSCKIFSQSSIHGIRTDSSNYNLCLFGGKFLRVITIDPESSQVKLVANEVRLNDWIWDCTWLKESSANHTEPLTTTSSCQRLVAAVLGHNSLVRIDVIAGVVLDFVRCENSCILYSARLFGCEWTELLVIVGTVFNQVLLWSAAPPLAVHNNQSSGQAATTQQLTSATRRGGVINSLSGHKGVVTSIDYSPGRCELCSTSDDRSVRVWQIVAGSEAVSLPPRCIDDWRNVEIQIVHVLYGHTARVWEARLLSDGVVSIGEDAICCLWSTAGQITQRFKGHKGRNIWSLSVTTEEDLIATGGGDGSIRVWRRSPVLSSSPRDVSVTLMNNPLQEKTDFARVVRLLASSHVLVMSNDGCLSVYDLITGEWFVLISNSQYTSYSVLSPHSNGRLVAIGNMNGHFRIMRVTTSPSIAVTDEWEERIYTGKVYSIHWIDVGDKLQQHLLLTTGPEGIVKLYDVTSTCSNQLKLEQIAEIFLPFGKQRWVSAACITAPRTVSAEFTLVCGDRSGSVHVFLVSRRGSNTDDQKQSLTNAVQTFAGIHRTTGVTFICYHEQRVYSCGRDGLYNVYSLGSDGQHRLEHLRSVRVLKGLDWLTRLVFWTNGDILVFGFHSNQFIIYSIDTNQQLLCIACGGGHRTWDFSLPSTHGDGECHLAYIHSRSIALYRANLLNYQTIVKPSLHGTEITCVRRLLLQNSGSTGHQILASADQDGQLSLLSGQTSLTDRPFNVDVITSVKGQSSSIRTLTTSRSHASDRTFKTSDDYNLLFSAGSMGELVAWKICIDSLVTPGDTVNAMDEICYAKEGSGIRGWWKRLAIHSVSLKRTSKSRKPWKKYVCDVDPETRYMCVDAFPVGDLLDWLGGNLHILLAVCSVGIIRVLCFDEHLNKFHLIVESFQHAHCLLKVSHLIDITEGVESSPHRRAYAIVAGTSGSIDFWDITDAVVKFCEASYHVNSGISESCQSVEEPLIDVPIYVSTSVEILNEVGLQPEINIGIDTTNIKETFSDNSYHQLPLADDIHPSNINDLNVQLQSVKIADVKVTVVKDVPSSISLSSAVISISSAVSLNCDNRGTRLRDTDNLTDTGTLHELMSKEDDSSNPHIDDEYEEDEEVNILSKPEDETFQISKRFCTLKAHQSGVNSLVLYRLEQDLMKCSYMLASGGDDNAIMVHTFQIHGLPASVDVRSRGTSVGAHTSQITGLHFINSSTLVSTSSDQRLTVWILIEDLVNRNIELRRIHSVILDIADVYGLEAWPSESPHEDSGMDFVVYGVGLQHVHINHYPRKAFSSGTAQIRVPMLRQNLAEL